MKLLLDTCVSPRTRAVLATEGHDTIWTGDWTPDPGDEAILQFAHRELRILVTLDKDFGELAVVFGKPHSGIVRLVAGAIVTVTADRTRLRPADTPDDSGQTAS